MYFLDIQLSISVGDFNQTNNRYWENDELFFWSPDLPELLAKQAQIICTWFDQHPALRDKLDYNKFGALVPNEYYDIVNPLIYKYNHEIEFKVKKPYSPMFQENEYWFRVDHNPAYKKWLNGINDLSTTISKKWLNAGDFNKGIVGCYSNFYFIQPGLNK